MAEPKEPQSYGSEGDWTTGNVGEEVNRLKGRPNSQHGDFYESRHDSERSAPDQGGKVSPVQIEENRQASGAGATDDLDAPVRKVTTAYGGKKLDSYFKERDYK
jgi:hypothetical protein